MPDSISFRPLDRADLTRLQRWLSEPHVVKWWREPLDFAGVEAKYGPRIDGIEPTHVFITEYRRRPIGWIQWYRWNDYPEHARQLGAAPESAGIDLAIGEEELIGRGLGASIIERFVSKIVFADKTISAIITDPEECNLRSLKAFEKAGFAITRKVEIHGENFRRCVMHLDRQDPD